MASSIGEIINTQVSQNETSGQSSIITISQQLVKRLNEQKANTAVDFENNGELIRTRQKIARLQNFKNRISDNVSAATKAKNAVSFIELHLDSMKAKLQTQLGSNSSEEKATLSSEFNELYAKINSRADGANQLIQNRFINLIGNTNGPEWKTDDLYSSTNQTGGFTKIEGAYLGSNFEIIDQEGFAWRLDNNKAVYLQHLNDGTGSPTGKQISTTDLNISSFNRSTNQVSLSNGIETLNGTINRGGLEVLTSEFYNDFTDDVAIQTAIDDIDKAIKYFDSGSARLKANTSILQGNNNLIKEKVNLLEKDVSNIISKEISESAARDKAANLKFTLAINNINIISQNSQGLIQNMLAGAQGPGPAIGVFELLGF